MWRYHRILLIILPLWVLSVDGENYILMDLISSGIVFPEVIETIYSNHMQSLLVAAQSYEQVIDKKTPIMQLHETLYEKSLKDLMHAVMPEMKEICQPAVIQESFKRACDNAQCQVTLGYRITFWHDFINNLHEQHGQIQLTHVPYMWFAHRPEASNEWKYMVNNATLKLNRSQCNYIIALMVSTFLPFALMARYDKEAFSTFLRAR